MVLGAMAAPSPPQADAPTHSDMSSQARSPILHQRASKKTDAEPGGNSNPQEHQLGEPTVLRSVARDPVTALGGRPLASWDTTAQRLHLEPEGRAAVLAHVGGVAQGGGGYGSHNGTGEGLEGPGGSALGSWPAPS